MSYDQKYTELDGTWHAIGWSEHTQCGIVIPMGSGYGLLPDKAKAHCGPDTKISETTVDGEPVAKPEDDVEASPLASDGPSSAVTATKPKAKSGK